MSKFKTGQEVLVVKSGGVFNRFDLLANSLELSNWAEKEGIAEGGKAVVVLTTQHPGFGSDEEREALTILLGMHKHPLEGVEIVVLEADGKQFMYAADAVEASGVEDTILDAQQDVTDSFK